MLEARFPHQKIDPQAQHTPCVSDVFVFKGLPNGLPVCQSQYPLQHYHPGTDGRIESARRSGRWCATGVLWRTRVVGWAPGSLWFRRIDPWSVQRVETGGTVHHLVLIEEALLVSLVVAPALLTLTQVGLFYGGLSPWCCSSAVSVKVRPSAS